MKAKLSQIGMKKLPKYQESIEFVKKKWVSENGFMAGGSTLKVDSDWISTNYGQRSFSNSTHER